jgi:Protein of unknown function (DUF3300)
VLALMQFPDVVRWLDANPAWTDDMGQAVTYQQADVLDAIQDYRRLVRDAGNLQTNQYQKVSQARTDGDIRIEPARPDIVYVPSYDAAAATQPQPAQQAGGVNPWLAFGGGAVVGALGAWALYSIFDDDDKDVNVYHHYNGRRRGINRYDNYYYAGRRRPAYDQWQPRDRPYREPRKAATRPGRLEHRAPADKAGQPLRPPVGSPAQTRRERREERQMERREQRQEHRTERQERQTERREQRQGQRQERQTERREERQERQQQRQERKAPRREKRQERRQDQQQRHTERREDRQERRELRQERRQEQRTERRDQRQNNQKKQSNKKKGGNG